MTIRLVRRRTALLTIAKTAGDSQTAAAGAAVATAPKVTVNRTSDSQLLTNVRVMWTAYNDSTVNGTLTRITLTGSDGTATTPWTLGASAGTQTLVASVLGSGQTVTFSATATAASGGTLTIGAFSATDQTALISGVVAAPPSVLVVDSFGNPVAGQTVTFAVTAGGGTRSPATVDTDANGVATLTSWTMGAVAGLNTLTATLAGATGSPVTFNANAVSTLATQMAVQSGGAQTGIVAGQAATATVFRVRDGASAAVQGVTVRFTIVTGSGSLSVASAVTNASGDASVTYTTHTTVATATIRAAFTNASGVDVTVDTTIASTFGAATKLGISVQPSANGTSGVALTAQPVILIQDANGNTVTTATDTITATVPVGNAVVAAGGTKAAVAGVATFTGFTLTDTDGGANTIRFATGVLTVADSTDVTLVPPVPTALAVTVQPSAVVAGQATLAVSIAVVDTNGTTVPGATNQVTIALTTAGGAVLSGTLVLTPTSGVCAFTALAIDLAGTYSITATSPNLTSVVTTSFTVTTAGAERPNEPAGFTQIHDTDFAGFTTASPAINGAAVQGLNRDATGTTGRAIVSDIAPFAGETVLDIVFAASLKQGSGPEHLAQSPLFYLANTFSELYTKFWFCVPVGWKQPNSSTVQKLLHVFGLYDGGGAGGGSLVVPALTGTADSTTAQVQLGIRYQNLSTVNGALGTFNGAKVNVNRGQWYKVEVYLKYNTGSAADGICTMFVDGAQRTHLANLTYKDGGAKEWTKNYLNPTYGGDPNTTVGTVQHLYMRKWYTSGKA